MLPGAAGGDKSILGEKPDIRLVVGFSSRVAGSAPDCVKIVSHFSLFTLVFYRTLPGLSGRQRTRPF